MSIEAEDGRRCFELMNASGVPVSGQHGDSFDSGVNFGSLRIRTVYLHSFSYQNRITSQSDESYWFLMLFVDRAGKCFICISFQLVP